MKALLVLAHGSRKKESNDEVMSLAQELDSSGHSGYDRVLCAFNQFSVPSAGSQIEALAAMGAALSPSVDALSVDAPAAISVAVGLPGTSVARLGPVLFRMARKSCASSRSPPWCPEPMASRRCRSTRAV